MRTTTRLRQLLAAPGLIVAPGAYDGFSARLIEAAGFSVVYMTGAGTAASHLGQPDLGLATLTEMANHAAHLSSAVSLPVIADADTGYGNALNAVRTVREYERAGVAGLHMEDQVAPKKCGHIAGKQVVPMREFAEKIRAASEHRTDPDFVIIARTDARAVTSLDDAIERGNRYAEAGADLIFVEAPQTVDEIRRVAREVKAPLLANMVQGGKTPRMPTDELERLGFRIAIFPAVCMAAAIPAIERALGLLRSTAPTGTRGRCCPHGHLPEGRLRLVACRRGEVHRRLSHSMSPAPRTLFEKIWSRHVVTEGAGDMSLLYVDRLLMHDGAVHTFDRLRQAGRARTPPGGHRRHRRPLRAHRGRARPPSRTPEVRGMVEAMGRHTAELGIPYFPPGDARQGIVHVMGPEQGFTLPGITLVCGDSHTATHGAFGVPRLRHRLLRARARAGHLRASGRRSRTRCASAWRAPARPASPPRT